MTPPALRFASLAALAMLALTGTASAQAPAGPVVIASDETLQWCLATQRSRDGGFDEIWLAPCTSPAARFVIDGRTGRVRSAARPGLCLSDTSGAGAAPFAAVMRECDDTSFGNFYIYDRGSRQLASVEADTGRRSRDSYCSVIVPRGQRSQIMNDLCNDRRVRTGHSTFVVAPVSAVAGANPPPPPPAASPAPRFVPPQGGGIAGRGPVRVTSATYGASCGVPAGNVTQHVADTCNGRTVCDYPVQVRVLGDPAPNCRKNFVVTYYCGREGPFQSSAPPEAGYGSRVAMLCD